MCSKYLYFCVYVYVFEKFKIFKNYFEFWLKLKKKLECYLKIDIVICICVFCVSFFVFIWWIFIVGNVL